MYGFSLQDFKKVAIDTETDGLMWYKDKVFGIAMSVEDKDFYWDLREHPKVINWLNDEFKTYKGKIINHSLKFDAHFLRKEGADLTNCDMECTMVRAALLDEHRFSYDLDSLAWDCLRKKKVDPYGELAEMFGGKDTRSAQIGNLHRAPVELTAKYAKMDTRLALELWEWQEKKIHEQNLTEIVTLEHDLLPVLTRMEARGIRVDVALAEKNMHKMMKLIKKLQNDLYKEVGKDININSGPQVKELFKPEKIEGTKQWKLIDGTIAPSTAKGNPSIGAETLKIMTHPVAKMIVELRTAIKIHGTFLRDQILGYQQNGRIYPNFKQCGTVNGRFSASNPALQAIPKRNPTMKKLTRTIFLPEEGEELLRCDFEQSDFRGFVHYTKSGPLVQAYREDPWTDFHGLVASLMSIPRSPHGGRGANAKQINLGSIFGMGPGKLAQEMGLPYTEEINRNDKVWLKPGQEAVDLFNLYHRSIPGVADFNKKASSVANSRGHVISIYGRHLRFPNRNFTYKAPGYLYAAFTSDLCKAAMVACDSIAPIKLQIHDEILFSIKDRGAVPQIKEAMENALGDKTDIPIRTNPEIGPNWADCGPLT